MATHIHFYKAQPSGKSVSDVVLYFNETIPSDTSLEKASQRFVRDGEALSEALFDVLPGGTIDQLLIALMTKRASLFKVRFFNPEKEG